MRDEYDFSNGIKNPYIKPQKTTVTIRLDTTVVEYFKGLSEQINIPYQTLINAYLADCAAKQRKPVLSWGE
ncbi:MULTISPECIES: BrnA antitoxin family protein [unclassified Desulfovibrio]|uniref:BrnA antitoxin family protein n=1 Tax=unclassified Desulfovibrio TaxID=2593640 RepID=UPI0013ED9491|nr:MULTISPECIES: BrnA antitoxin family protein [unclassified Desulfovibrio]